MTDIFDGLTPIQIYTMKTNMMLDGVTGSYLLMWLMPDEFGQMRYVWYRKYTKLQLVGGPN